MSDKPSNPGQKERRRTMIGAPVPAPGATESGAPGGRKRNPLTQTVAFEATPEEIQAATQDAKDAAQQAAGEPTAAPVRRATPAQGMPLANEPAAPPRVARSRSPLNQPVACEGKAVGDA